MNSYALRVLFRPEKQRKAERKKGKKRNRLHNLLPRCGIVFRGTPWAGASATSRASGVELDFDCHPLRLCTMSLLVLPVKRQSYCGVTSSPATASFRLDLDPSHRREFWSRSKRLVAAVDFSKIKRRTGGGTMPLGPGWRKTRFAYAAEPDAKTIFKEERPCNTCC